MRNSVTTAVAAAIALAIVGAGEAQTPGAAGKHTMDGKVTKVDAKRGWVDVKTPEGDSVTVELGMSASASADTMRKTK